MFSGLESGYLKCVVGLASTYQYYLRNKKSKDNIRKYKRSWYGRLSMIMVILILMLRPRCYHLNIDDMATKLFFSVHGKVQKY